MAAATADRNTRRELSRCHQRCERRSRGLHLRAGKWSNSRRGPASARILASISEICREQGAAVYSGRSDDRHGPDRGNFAVDHWNIAPDILVAAKGLSSGYAPLGAVIASKKVTPGHHFRIGRLSPRLHLQRPPDFSRGGPCGTKVSKVTKSGAGRGL